MTRRQRLRRVGILCCHFLRNLAFYGAGRRKGSLILKEQYWATANGNFLDICVLEWCKLFGDVRAQHFWRKVVTEQQEFFGGLLKTLSLTDVEFDAYVKEVKTYRDKFVAHLDSDLKMQIPDLELARKSVSYLYDYILANEDEGDFFIDAPHNASSHYARFAKEGKEVHEKQHNKGMQATAYGGA